MEVWFIEVSMYNTSRATDPSFDYLISLKEVMKHDFLMKIN
jgi:hypothetical protein